VSDRPSIEARGDGGGVGKVDARHDSSLDRDYAAEIRSALLEGYSAPTRHFDAGATVRPAGQPRNAVFVIEQGWIYSSRVLPAGGRQLLELLLPGQVAGLGEFGLERPLSALHALGETVVREVAWDRLRSCMCESPDFSENFALLVARERLMLEERLTSLGRRDALQRLGHFLLEMHHRIRPPADRFRLPVTQQFLADLLGMTSVHVSRMLTELRDSHLVDMSDHGVELLDPDELALKTDFDPAYLALQPFCESD
jgi:CRP-like cAMP-binding protein